ncbi:DUF421 domain-containing protein [Aquibacillus albus]|uniref:Uncharacterized membrane protein YcaP (DUF421 family) n=1 Tax=Aquibacillus albus TaxID=1168171 RepID=A0ABS2N0B2_9BACI|nr:DUF421 domain-containing protein [Aquibacillus albus]MBM7571582.1 uncharacterized membrane protein YcaP (DUF421 family) [Aquibacillus albus]
MSMYEILIRILLTFIVLLTLTRMMGRKELSQMTFFNFVSGIAIGSIGANLVVNQNLSIRNGILALAGWSILTVIMGFIDIKSITGRKVISGQPVILIKDGQIMEHEMRKARLDINKLNAMLREKKVFSVADVDYAIFETNGKLSVMKKEPKQTATKADTFTAPTMESKFPIPTEVVSDGMINMKNLQELNLSEDWLKQELSKAGIDDILEVFYAEVQKDGSLYIDTKNDVVH